MPAQALALYGASNLLSTFSARRQAKEEEKRRRAALAPLQAQRSQLGFGLTETQGNLAQAAERRSLGSLARRGVLSSSTAPGEVAAAVAPIEEQRQARLQDLDMRIASAHEQIAAETTPSGYGAAFGNALGEVGSFLALRAGMEAGRKRNQDFLQVLERLLQEEGPGGVPMNMSGAGGGRLAE